MYRLTGLINDWNILSLNIIKLFFLMPRRAKRRATCHDVQHSPDRLNAISQLQRVVSSPLDLQCRISKKVFIHIHIPLFFKNH